MHLTAFIIIHKGFWFITIAHWQEIILPSAGTSPLHKMINSCISAFSINKLTCKMQTGADVNYWLGNI